MQDIRDKLGNKDLKNTEPAKIIDDVLFNLDKEVKDAMPNSESMKKNAQK